jgi:hypothetical protein
MQECSALIDKYKAAAAAEREARYIAAVDAEAAAYSAPPDAVHAQEPSPCKAVTQAELRETLHTGNTSSLYLSISFSLSLSLSVCIYVYILMSYGRRCAQVTPPAHNTRARARTHTHTHTHTH